MNVEQEPRLLICVECAALSEERAHGWRAYLGDDDEVYVFCLGCAEREFGEGAELAG